MLCEYSCVATLASSPRRSVDTKDKWQFPGFSSGESNTMEGLSVHNVEYYLCICKKIHRSTAGFLLTNKTEIEYSKSTTRLNLCGHSQSGNIVGSLVNNFIASQLLKFQYFGHFYSEDFRQNTFY